MTEATQQSILREAFAGMLRHISRRPSQYTRTGGFWEVVAYVEGHVCGSGYPTGEINLEGGMAPFGRWFARRFGPDGGGHWAGLLFNHCGEDERLAVEKLWPLYEEYMREMQTSRPAEA